MNYYEKVFWVGAALYVLGITVAGIAHYGWPF